MVKYYFNVVQLKNHLMAWWLGFGAPAMARVQSLIRELRSCKPRGMAKLVRNLKATVVTLDVRKPGLPAFLIINLPGPLPQCRCSFSPTVRTRTDEVAIVSKRFQYLSGHPHKHQAQGSSRVSLNLTHMPMYITFGFCHLWIHLLF